MKLSWILNTVGFLALVLILIVSVLHAAGVVSFEYYTTMLLICTIIWFSRTLISRL